MGRPAGGSGERQGRRPPLGRRALVALLGAPLVALAAGLLTIGAGAQTPPAPAASGEGCTERTLRFPVTDDPAEVARQNAFERTGAPITAAGFHAEPTPPTPTLHAAAHGSVVVFYRADLPAEELRPLRALADDGRSSDAAVVVTPRRQAKAVTAVSLGRQLDCPTAGAAQSRRVRSFAAAVYPSLAP